MLRVSKARLDSAFPTEQARTAAHLVGLADQPFTSVTPERSQGE